MAYTPTEWQSGDIVTSEKLNKIENGIADAGGVLVATVDTQTYALDKTWKEIDEAPFTVVRINDGTNHLKLPVLAIVRSSPTQLKVTCMSPEDPTGGMTFVATSEDGYPVLQTQ